MRVVFGLRLQFWGLFSGEELEESGEPLLVVEFVAAEHVLPSAFLDEPFAEFVEDMLFRAGALEGNAGLLEPDPGGAA